jgi:hypothetical protein
VREALLWAPKEVMTNDNLISYVGSDCVCPHSKGIILGVTGDDCWVVYVVELEYSSTMQFYGIQWIEGNPHLQNGL